MSEISISKKEKPKEVIPNVKEVFAHQLDLLSKLKEKLEPSGTSVDEYFTQLGNFSPSVSSPYFAYTVEFSKAVPLRIADVIKTALHNKPDFASSLPSFESDIEHLRDILEQAQQLKETLPKDSDSQQKVQQYIDQLENSINKGLLTNIEFFKIKQIQHLLYNTLGISTSLDPEVAEEIYETLRNINSQTEEITYFSQTLTEAKNYLIAIAPNIADLIRFCADEIIFVKKNRQEFRLVSKPIASIAKVKKLKPIFPISNKMLETNSFSQDDSYHNFLDRHSNWGYGRTTLISVMQCNPQGASTEHRKKYHIENVLVFSHELMHSVSTYLLNAQTDVLAPRKKSTKKHYMGSVARMIQEGISLAAEREVANYIINSDTFTEEEKSSARTAIKYTDLHLTESRKLWNIETRSMFLGEEEPVPRSEHIGDLAYTEGALLSQILQAKGWKLSDLPFFIHQVQHILHDEAGIKNFNEAHEIPITKKPELGWLSQLEMSRYLRIRKRIKKLSPTTAA